ncbi:MAG: hypothetical protein GXP48_09915 [Acidobacteria bacterium]|nr:hypothetical protein [Acidobacteriota bacterium]
MNRSNGSSRSLTAMIGDIVDSRKYRDQRFLFNTVDVALSWVNERIEAVQALQITVGDQFQGVYGDLGAALDAALLVRLKVWETCDLRFGLGIGEIRPLKPDLKPYSQTGSGWWFAREAIDRVEVNQSKRVWPKSLRTWLRSDDAHLEAAINSFLMCRDHILGRMDRKDARILLGLFLGETQSTVAKDLEITQPSVTSRQRTKGANAVFRAHALMKELAQ